MLGCYQRPGIDYTETFAPVASDATIRALLCVANYKDWEIQHIDVETAFLNAPLKEKAYLKMPKGYELIRKGQNDNVVLKLNRALYGLVQAPKAWMEEFIKSLTKLGCKRSWTEPCLLTMIEGNKVVLCITVYVDDCLIVGEKEKVMYMIDKIERLYTIKRLGSVKKYLGYNISRNKEKGTIKIDQTDFIHTFAKTYGIGMSDIKTPGSQRKSEVGDTTILDPVIYRSGVGSLLYCAKCTRPDVANTIRSLSRHMDSAEVSHMHEMYRAIQYLLNTKNLGVTYDKNQNLILEAFVDSDYANNDNCRRSTTGYVVMLAGGAIQWKSQLQSTVSLSSSEAEYKALSACAAEVTYLKQLLKELGIMQKKVVIKEDNVGAMKIAENWMSSKRTKHIDIKYHHVRELVEKGEIEIQHLSTEKQPADMLTKNLPKTTYEKHRRFIMNLD